MFTPREQQQNPGCLDETLGRYTDQCHFVLSFYPRRQEFEPCMLLLWLRNHRVLSDRKKRCMHTYVTFEGIPDTRCPLPRELRRAPASKLSTHVICNPRDEAARLKKRNLLRHCAAPQQLCETRRCCKCCKRAQSSELEHIIAVQGPQRQRKSSSADAPVCQDREHKLCSLLSYCAAPQPLCSASCGGKCARKWHLHSSSHTCQHALRQRALTPPHAAPKRSPACPLSSLAPCQTRPRRARRALRANGCRAKLPGEAILPWRGPRGARAAARRAANLPGGTWRTRPCPRRPAPRPPPARPHLQS